MQIKVFWLHGEEFEKKIEEINEWVKNKDIKQITVAANDVVFIQYDEIIELGLAPKGGVEEHNCTENIDYGEPDWRFIRFVSSFSNTKDDTVHFYGNCSVCGKKLKKVFKYVETRDRDTDEIIDLGKETEKVALPIPATLWRQLNANDIISSIDVGLSVLDGKEFSKEYHRLLVLVEEIAKMLAREV